MVTFLVLVLVLAVVGALGVLVLRFGADSRDGRDWQPYELGGSRVPRW